MLDGKDIDLRLWNPNNAANRTIDVEDDGIAVPLLEAPSTLVLRPGFAAADARIKRLEGPCEILSSHVMVIVTIFTTSQSGKKKKTKTQTTKILNMLIPPTFPLGSILSQNGASAGSTEEQHSSWTTWPSETETETTFFPDDGRTVGALGWMHGKRIAIRRDN